jgi:hypothetical protein
MAYGKYVFTGKNRPCNTYIQLNSQELTIYNHEIQLKCVQGFGSYLTLNTMTTLQTPTGNCCSGKHVRESNLMTEAAGSSDGQCTSTDYTVSNSR